MTTVSIQHHATSELRHVTFADQIKKQTNTSLSSECSRYVVHTFLFCDRFQTERYGNTELVNLSPLEVALLSKKFFQTTCGIVRSQRAHNQLKLYFTQPSTANPTSPIKPKSVDHEHVDMIGWGPGNGRFYKISSSHNSSLVLLWYIRPRPLELHIHIDCGHEITERMHQMVLSIVAGARRIHCTTPIGRAHLLQYDMFRVLQPCLRELIGGVDVLAGVPSLELDELCIVGKERIEYNSQFEGHSIKQLILKEAHISPNRKTKINNRSRFFMNLRSLKIFGASHAHHRVVKLWADYGLALDKFYVVLEGEIVDDQLPESLSTWLDLLIEYPAFAQKTHITANLITYSRNRTCLNSFCYQRYPRYLMESFGHPDELDCLEFLADPIKGVPQRSYSIRFENNWILVATHIRVICL